jgi:hypothetical protein
MGRERSKLSLSQSINPREITPAIAWKQRYGLADGCADVRRCETRGPCDFRAPKDGRTKPGSGKGGSLGSPSWPPMRGVGRHFSRRFFGPLEMSLRANET